MLKFQDIYLLAIISCLYNYSNSHNFYNCINLTMFIRMDFFYPIFKYLTVCYFDFTSDNKFKISGYFCSPKRSFKSKLNCNLNNKYLFYGVNDSNYYKDLGRFCYSLGGSVYSRLKGFPPRKEFKFNYISKVNSLNNNRINILNNMFGISSNSNYKFDDFKFGCFKYKYNYSTDINYLKDYDLKDNDDATEDAEEFYVNIDGVITDDLYEREDFISTLPIEDIIVIEYLIGKAKVSKDFTTIFERINRISKSLKGINTQGFINDTNLDNYEYINECVRKYLTLPAKVLEEKQKGEKPEKFINGLHVKLGDKIITIAECKEFYK